MTLPTKELRFNPMILTSMIGCQPKRRGELTKIWNGLVGKCLRSRYTWIGTAKRTGKGNGWSNER